MKFIKPQFARFLIAGSFNTGFTYLIYISLLYFFSYYVSYTITYMIGIFVAYFINTLFVFKQNLSFKKALQFPLVYLVQYALGIAILYIAVTQFGMDPFYAPLLVIIISIPITYVLSKFILKDRITA